MIVKTPHDEGFWEIKEAEVTVDDTLGQDKIILLRC